jgi:GAF domain-containing protein
MERSDLLHHGRAIGVLSVSSAKAGAFSGSHETMARYLLPRLSEELQRARAEGRAVTLGHACGDAVLRIFADRVREGTRRSDVFVRRG